MVELCLHSHIRLYGILLNVLSRRATLTLKSTIISDITPCSLLKVDRRFGGTSVDFQRTTRRYIPEGSTLHYHRLRTSNPTTIRFTAT
jgi:hypothetical protein